MSFSVTAIITLYNEADIIRWVLKHLYEQSVGVYIIDNWSTDGSADIVRGFPLAGYEKFPADGPSKYYSWAPLLKRVEDVAAASKADWIVHHDADEIRRSDVRGEMLVDAFARVQEAGFNAVNFQVYHFLPTDDGFTGDPENYFNYYTVDHGDCNMRQVKAWRNTGQRVDLASTGGHFANFPGVSVFPQKFVLKHYPLRTSEQSARKVLTERIGRYDPAELARRWHVQYKALAESRQWIHDPATLRAWRGPYDAKQ